MRKLNTLCSKWYLFMRDWITAEIKKTGIEGYGGSGCSDIGAVKAHVQLTGPTPADDTVDCSTYTKLYTSKVMPGTYSATVTLLDGFGNPVTKAVTSGEANAVVGGDIANLLIDFDTKVFLKAYTGSFQVRASWGMDMLNCMSASPVVDQESIKLVPKGAQTPLTSKTTPGTPLDGRPAPCQIPGQEIYEKATDLPVGPYRLQLWGYSKMQLSYCKAMDIYIGPSTRSQPWTITVPATGPDGGAGGICE